MNLQALASLLTPQAASTASLPWGRSSEASSGLAQGCLETPGPLTVTLPGEARPISQLTTAQSQHHSPPFLPRLQALFNSLCRVLCILRLLYLCSIGPMSVFFLARDKPRISNCSPKPLYSWMQAAAPDWPAHIVLWDNLPLLCALPSCFNDAWPAKTQPPAP